MYGILNDITFRKFPDPAGPNAGLPFFLMCIVAVALSVLRITGHTDQAFQAVAHLAVGGCVGASISLRSWRYADIAVFLSVVETACFFLLKK